jgi:spermidine/putrescine-binding protein
MITSQAQNTATALAWLDHLNTPESQKKIAAATGYGICNQNGVDLVPKDYAEVYHLDDPNFIAGLDYWKAVPDRQKYLDVLNAVVAA